MKSAGIAETPASPSATVGDPTAEIPTSRAAATATLSGTHQANPIQPGSDPAAFSKPGLLPSSPTSPPPLRPPAVFSLPGDNCRHHGASLKASGHVAWLRATRGRGAPGPRAPQTGGPVKACCPRACPLWEPALPHPGPHVERGASAEPSPLPPGPLAAELVHSLPCAPPRPLTFLRVRLLYRRSLHGGDPAGGHH